VDDVTRNARCGKLAEAVAEARLCEEGGAGGLEHVAGDDDEVGPMLDGSAYDAAPRLGGGATQESEDLGRRLSAQSPDGAVEMEVTGVQEAKGLEGRHCPPSVADGRDSSPVVRRA
jgi:hypothetical protein